MEMSLTENFKYFTELAVMGRTKPDLFLGELFKKVGVPYVQQVLRDLGHYTLKVSPLLVAVGGRQIIRLLRKFYTFLPF